MSEMLRYWRQEG